MRCAGAERNSATGSAILRAAPQLGWAVQPPSPSDVRNNNVCVLLQSEIMTLSVARCRARRRRPCRHHRALYRGAGRTNGSAAARRTRARSGGVLRAGPRRSGLWRPAYTWRISCPAARRSFYRSARRRGSHLIFCNVAAVPRPRPRPPAADRPSPPRSRDINITELLRR